ncbi:DUF3095 family protein [Arcticibacterium luteifluviistationis]|uniref:DUF3095 domain-containing protein n=1 Tax=Arcticibacterium luteifluviistationis TaxID=1784714 RepID=A0A2Z4G7S5_9BACT|nr:DUF3095 family protein [Arcticibacterium luteifluviistationis]AWV97160.1 hypothetical protein DJ013_02810 [Arcticibacterium luteifluviistationis]
MEDIQYYTKLKNSNKNLVELLDSESAFSDVPNTWHVVVVDILNSTQAVDEGKHHQVNLTATGSIISVLNTIRKEKQSIEIPYFFGGDGATFILPSLLLKKIVLVLDNYSLHIKRNTNLTLRVGHVPVSHLTTENCSLKIVKHRLSAQLSIPIVLGNGLKKAEEIIKRDFQENNLTNFKEDLLNLEGMECRWEQVNPNQTQNKVVCLLLDAVNDSNQREVYKNVLTKMDAIFGTFEIRQPIKSDKLKLSFSILKIWEEMKISLAKKNLGYLFKNWISTLFGKFYLSLSPNGIQYLKQIGQLSHTFMLDGMINTIFTAEQPKIDLFLAYLNQLEKDKKIIFGIHITHASVMSCYVLDRKTKHSHFVDGTEGGYTSAAKMFKEKMTK